MADRRTTFIDKCIKKPDGGLAIGQRPNALLLLWVVALVVTKAAKTGTVHHLAQVVAFGTIFAWAYAELFQGVNYFRRFLGAAVLVLSIMSAYQSL